jgi:hypothetical protein
MQSPGRDKGALNIYAADNIGSHVLARALLCSLASQASPSSSRLLDKIACMYQLLNQCYACEKSTIVDM